MKSYFFTRGSLASELIDAGISVQRVSNVYNPARPAWKADFSPKLVQIVSSYYKAQGLPVPQIIKDQETVYRKQNERDFFKAHHRG